MSIQRLRFWQPNAFAAIRLLEAADEFHGVHYAGQQIARDLGYEFPAGHDAHCQQRATNKCYASPDIGVGGYTGFECQFGFQFRSGRLSRVATNGRYEHRRACRTDTAFTARRLYHPGTNNL
jgi:hypothetical protein